jgi:hypothetical protein
MNNSRIVCAANKVRLGNGKTIIIAGARHWDNIMHQVVNNIEDEIVDEIQGFIDQYGNFYNRLEAWIIAETNGQIIRRVGGDMTLEGNGRLFSENLY